MSKPVTTMEQRSRQEIDRLLAGTVWAVQDVRASDIHAAPSVALREFPLEAGLGYADHLLYVDGEVAGIIETKKQGATQTGAEMRFTNGLDPEPRARHVFAFNRPETLAGWLAPASEPASGALAIGPDHPSCDAANGVSAETSPAYLQLHLGPK